MKAILSDSLSVLPCFSPIALAQSRHIILARESISLGCMQLHQEMWQVETTNHYGPKQKPHNLYHQRLVVPRKLCKSSR
jgi:hypothetical protein